MEKTLAVINQMEQDGVIGRHALIEKWEGFRRRFLNETA